MGRGYKRIMVTTNKIGKTWEGVVPDTSIKRNTAKKKTSKKRKK